MHVQKRIEKLFNMRKREEKRDRKENEKMMISTHQNNLTSRINDALSI